MPKKWTKAVFIQKFGELPADVEACEIKVMKKGYDKSSAIAICRSALGMTSEEKPAGTPQDIHGRGTRTDGNKEVFDIPTTSEGGAIHTPQFVKVRVPKEQFELDPLWKKTQDVMNVEIFEAGTWKGREFTEQDLSDAVQNFRKGILGAEPYVTIDHDKTATGQFSKALDGMALGFVKNLYKVGKKLIADFTKVPRVIAELIMAGPLKNKSIELWPEFEAADGTIYKNVLEAVTFTGKIPAVAGLSDIVSLFKRETGITQKDNRRKITLTKEVKMSDERIMEIGTSEYTTLLKFKAQSEASEDQIKKLQFKADEFKSQAETLEKKVVELEKFKADTAKANEVREHNEAVRFADSLITKGKILPANKDLYIEQYKMMKSKGPEMFKAFTDEIRARKATVITGEMSAPNWDSPAVVNKIDVPMMFSKTGGKGTSKLFEETDKAVKAYCAKHKVTYAEAMKNMGLLEDKMEAEEAAIKKFEEAESKSKKKMEEEDADDDEKDADDDEEGEEDDEEDADDDEEGEEDDEKLPAKKK